MSAPRTRGYEEGEGMDGADGPCRGVPPKFDSGALWGRGSEGGAGCAGRRRGDTRRERAWIGRMAGVRRKIRLGRAAQPGGCMHREGGRFALQLAELTVCRLSARRRLMRGWRWEARVKGGGRNGRAHFKQDGTHRKARGRTTALYIANVEQREFLRLQKLAPFAMRGEAGNCERGTSQRKVTSRLR
ncbi:hypothetical protein B0H16DRAFT_1620354, partial [Mycena metata]